MSDALIFDFDEEPTSADSKIFDFLRESIQEKTKDDKDYITVYLAGPIEAELNNELPHAIEWRENIKQLFALDAEVVWDVRDPNNGKTDGKNYIQTENNSHYYNPYVLFRTEIENVADSDFVIVNLSKFKTGFGAPFIMGYAYCKNIPIICICEPGVLPEHPFITQSVDAFVYSEEEAVNVLRFMLNEKM